MKNIFRYFSLLPFFTALRLVFLEICRKLFFPYIKLEYSFAGESSIINDLFNYKRNGFYIDVGCNHPIKSSNTFSLYLKGWKGIVIDANKKLTDEFKQVRKKDIVINAAIASEAKEVNYYDFDADLLNTISDEVGKGVQQGYNLKKVTKMTTRSLTSILKEQGIKKDTQLDLLSIDVEGFDFEVLKSLDFSLYRPEIIVIECHGFDLEQLTGNAVFNYLQANNYRFFGYISMNAYFRRND